MTVPQMIMVGLGAIAISCFVITWLILSSEDINKAANRLEYKAHEWYDATFVSEKDEDQDACPEWADEQKWRETCLK